MSLLFFFQHTRREHLQQLRIKLSFLEQNIKRGDGSRLSLKVIYTYHAATVTSYLKNQAMIKKTIQRKPVYVLRYRNSGYLIRNSFLRFIKANEMNNEWRIFWEQIWLVDRQEQSRIYTVRLLGVSGAGK